MAGVCVVSWASGGILRLSKVSGKETADTERLEWKHDGKREVLFVEKQVIVSDTDVQSVMRSVSRTARRIAAAMSSGRFFLFPPRSAYPSSIDPTSTDGVKSYA